MNLKNLFSLCVALLTFVIVGGTAIAQTTWYVDAVFGNDNYTGSASTFQSGLVGPKKTIQAMLNSTSVVNGDLIEIKEGTYDETVTLTKRVELYVNGGSGVTVTNLTLNTASTTDTKIATTNYDAGENITITGTLHVQSGDYNITSARVILASGATLQLSFAAATYTGMDNAVTTTAGNFTLTFTNSSASSYLTNDFGTNDPGNVNFNGSAAVTMPGSLTAQGNVTIASGASVVLGANVLTVQGNFTNNGSYSGTGRVDMTGAAKTVSGSGTFMNLKLSNAGGEFEVGSNLSFVNVDASTASLLDLDDGILDLNNFNIETPGGVTVGANYDNGGAIKATGATTGGKLIFSGTAGTIGNVNFTLGQNISLDYLTINKPTGSTVTIPTGNKTVTVGKQFDFTSGIFQLNDNDLELAAGHGSAASIGGNINGTAGSTFTILTSENVTVSGAGQINVAFTVNGGAAKTYTFTQLTTIGNSLTVTNGLMVTSSLQLINGAVALNNASQLTLNTTAVSITGNLDVNGTAQVKGTSNITVQGTIDLETGCKIDKSAGTVSSAGTFTLNGAAILTAAGASTTVAGGNFTSGTGNITLSGPLTVTGNIQFGASTVQVAGTISATGSFNDGNATVSTSASGNLTAGTSVTFGTGNDVVAGNVQSGTAIATGGGTLTVSGNLIAGTTFTSAAGNVSVTGSASSGGHFTVNGAGNVTVGGTITTTSSGNVVTASTGTLTVTLTATIAGNVVVGDGDIYFQGTGSHSVGGQLTTGAAGGTGTDLRFGGPVTIAGASGIQPGNHVQEWRFDGDVTLTHSTTNDIDLDAVAGGVFAIDFYGAVTARDLLMNDDRIHLVTFKTSGTAKLISQLRNITFIDLGNVLNAAAKIELESAADSWHTLKISGDLNLRPTGVTSTLLTVGANSRVVLNGSAALTTYVDNNWQNIDLTSGAMSIANLEVANTGTDASPAADGGGNAETDETKESVVITGNALTVTKLWLTSNGIRGTNLTIADGGTITRTAGAVEIADPTFAGTRNLVYSNTSALTTGREYTVAGTVVNLTLNGSSTVTMSASRTITGVLTINSGNTLNNAGTGGPFNLTITNTSATTVATINGSFSGGGTLIDLLNTANVAHTATGTGTVSNFTASTFDNAGDVYTFSIANVTGNLATSGSAGTFNVTTSGPSSFGGNVTLDNDIISLAKNTTVTGNLSVTAATSFTASGTLDVAGTITKAGAGTWSSKAVTMTGTTKTFTHTSGNITIDGNLTVTGDYTQANGALTLTSNGIGSIAGNMTWAQAALTLSVGGNFTVNGSFTGFAGGAGSVVFPAASVSSLILKGAVSMTGTNATFTFNTGSGRVNFNGTAAQTLSILGGNLSIARVALGNAAGLTVSGAGELRTTNLLLTAGTLTHNGLLNMGVNATDRIIRDGGALATFAAAGPGEVEYVNAGGFSTGFETVSTLNKIIVNAASGNPTFTLDKNVTILSGGQLNLSRGTLAIGGNSLIVQNTSTITRAEGAISGTPTLGTGITLQYFNTEGDLTTGSEFTNDGSITTLTVNSPSRSVILGGNVKVAGNANLVFGTLNLGDFTFDVTGDFDNDGAVSSSTSGKIKFTGAGASALKGLAVGFPHVEVAKTNTLTLTPDTDEADLIFSKLTLTTGNLALAANPNNPDDITITGDFTVASTFGTFNTTNGDDWFFKGSFTYPSGAGALTQDAGDVFTFNGTSQQTINCGKSLNEVTVNNTAGVVLAANLTVANGGTLTMTAGNIATGSNTLQLGTTGTATLTRASGMVIGTMKRFLFVRPIANQSTLFPLGTGTLYRPATITFTGIAGSGFADSLGQLVTVTHTNSLATGDVGFPITSGTLTLNKMVSLYWTVTFTSTPVYNPQVQFGSGGYSFGDIQKVRIVYRYSHPSNTWLVPGTFVTPFYAADGTPTFTHTGVSGWDLDQTQLFSLGYESTFAVANPIANQSLTVGGAAYSKTIQSAPAVFSGNAGTLTYSVTSSDTTVATAAVASGVLTVTPVAAGTATITLTATDVNNEQLSTQFTATVSLPVPTEFTVSGTVTYDNTASTPLAGVTVTLNPGARTATTDSTGAYSFANVVNGSYTLTTSSAAAWLSTAVNSTDALQAANHFNGVVTLTGVKFQAADVNNSNTVNYTDALRILRKSVLTGEPAFERGDWTFETKSVTVSGANVTVNVKGLAVGDANGSGVPALAKSSPSVTTISNGVLRIGANSSFEVPVTVNSDMKLGAVSLRFSYPSELVEFEGVSSRASGIIAHAENGYINIAWADLTGGKEIISLKANETLINLKFKSTANFKANGKFNLELDGSFSEMATSEGSILKGVGINVPAVEASIPSEFALKQNYPNPFNPSTTIEYALKASGKVSLTIYNVLGQQVASIINEVQEAGLYKIVWNANDMPSGIYYYRLNVEGDQNYTQTQKMMLLK